jgi:hypothetical protein
MGDVANLKSHRDNRTWKPRLRNVKAWTGADGDIAAIVCTAKPRGKDTRGVVLACASARFTAIGMTPDDAERLARQLMTAAQAAREGR